MYIQREKGRLKVRHMEINREEQKDGQIERETDRMIFRLRNCLEVILLHHLTLLG